MRGFGAMCLLRRSRCMFLAPQCAALRCPWVNAFVLPVVRVPSCARGPPCVFVYCTSAHVQQNCTVVQYKRKGRTPTNERTNEPRTKFHLIERIFRRILRRRFTNYEEWTRRQVKCEYIVGVGCDDFCWRSFTYCTSLPTGRFLYAVCCMLYASML